MVVAASLFVHMFVLGSIYSFGVFFTEYLEVYDTPQAIIALIGSVGAGLMLALGVYSGAWADKYGNCYMIFAGGLLIGIGYLLASFSTEVWHLFLTQGVITGIGYSLAFVPGVSVVGQWFDKKRGLAIGIAASGSGLGQFALTLITDKLIRSYGWRSSLRILAAVLTSGICICALFIRRNFPCNKYAKDPVDNIDHWNPYTDHNFIVLVVSTLTVDLGLYMPFTHVSQYAIETGISSERAVLLLAVMGIFSAVGRISFGFAGDYFGKVEVLQFCNIGGGIIMLSWLLCDTFPSLFVFACLFGAFAGGEISLLPSVCASLFGIEKIGSIVGLFFTTTALGFLLAAPLGGLLNDATGTYTASIVSAGVLMILGGVLQFFLKKKKKIETTKIAVSCKSIAEDKEDEEDNDSDELETGQSVNNNE